MVEFANALAQASPHKLAYIHMPVPRERDDDVFHLPFRRLALGEGTELYLGVVSAADGAEGPGTFHARLYDALYALDPNTLDGRVRITET